MSILREELITNHLLLDYFDLWDEFDIRKVDDPKTVRYYDLLMNHIQNQIDAGVKWLESDEARDYFFSESEYQRDVFRALEDEWDSILEGKYPSVEALLSEVYRRGKAQGYSDMREHIRYTEQDKLALSFVQEYNFGLIRNIDYDTRSQIKAKIIEAVIVGEHPYTVAPKILDVAEERLDGSNFTPKQRATMIARTEVSRVQNTGILQSYVNEGYAEVKILTAEDDHVCDLCLKYAFEFNKDEDITFENRGKERVHNISKLIKGGLFPPFHPLCRCTYLSVWGSKGEVRWGVIDLTGLNSSKIPSKFPSDNTPIPELMDDNLVWELESFEIFSRTAEIENAEIFDANGKSLSGIILGGESYVNITWQEVKRYVDNGAIVLIHNHPENYDNVHSPADLILQLKSGLKYCIVESHTKRYIVKNSNKQLTDDDQLVKDISNFNYKFRKEMDKLTDERLIRLTENTNLDYWETENLRKQIKEKVLEEHINDYEEGISKFFEEDTGLTLYVHDK